MKPDKKLVNIVVEGTEHQWPKDDITYAEVVKLEVLEYPQNPPLTYAVTYSFGNGNMPDRTLTSGGSVKVKEGMVFSVSETGQS